MALRRSERITALRGKKHKTRVAMGKASVEKGRRFEDEVAELYELLGARVTQNIEVCQKKVDLLAAFPLPGSNREHRILVECKDENKAVNANQRVQAFKGLLELERKTGEAESAEIITRVPWSDQAKGFASNSGVGLYTLLEKTSQSIDFRNYLRQLVRKFEVA